MSKNFFMIYVNRNYYSSYFLSPYAAAAVKATREQLPLTLHILIVLEFEIALGLAIAATVERRDKIIKQQRVHPFVLILGVDSHKKQVDNVAIALQRSQQMIPTRGE